MNNVDVETYNKHKQYTNDKNLSEDVWNLD